VHPIPVKASLKRMVVCFIKIPAAFYPIVSIIRSFSGPGKGNKNRQTSQHAYHTANLLLEILQPKCACMFLIYRQIHFFARHSWSIVRNSPGRPTTISFEQVPGVSRYVIRAVLSRGGDEVIDLAMTNLIR
jgi:hypothetical protein